MRGASRSPSLAAWLFASRLLSFLATVGPLLIAIGAFRRAGLLAFLSPGVLVSMAGLALAAIAVSSMLQLAVWSGATGRLGVAVGSDAPKALPGELVRRIGDHFPRFLAIWGLFLAARIGRFVLLGTLAVAAAIAYFGKGSEYRVAGAGGLALAIALWLISRPLLPLVFRIAMGRAGALGEGALVALYEAGGQLVRRPLPPVLITILIGVAGVISAILVNWSAAIAAAGASGAVATGAWAVAGLALAAIASFLAMARMGGYVAATLDDADARGSRA
ncbi:hypothetical protein AKJ08_0903 [Vulgatibacter incomptus]|uniref:Uncharacterized protein n=1 Tax=Vulgatibacter incomptus TaxID=1391653 RepID=A0A0K1PAS5_9BACT|nr:hypothetical protein AKJ08_0903 [Vulgatibacter incomptus]